jgi:hypothetical protein
MKNGIGISLKRMKTVELVENGKVARLGPGLINGEVLRGLEALGKRAGKKKIIIKNILHELTCKATGNCQCAGLGGLLLGGGKGILQGKFGLVSDNLVEARVILANGSAVTASESSNPDLFWAFKGAGHNFGIVSEFRQKVYDNDPKEQWYVADFIFSQEKLEDLVPIMSSLTDNGKKMHPVGLGTFLSFLRVPEKDATNVSTWINRKATTVNLDEAVLRVLLIYQGTHEEASKIFQPFQNIPYISVQLNTTNYAGTTKIIGVAEDGAGCRPPGSRHSLPISLETYNLTATRQAYSLFNNYTAKHKEFSRSQVLFESYSVQGVRAVSDESSAVSDRQFNILV